MQIRVGTSGYSYKEWKGSFYPEKLAASKMLTYYAERLPAVEVNYTFRRMPSEKTVARWVAETPDSFRFVLKVHQRISHRQRLKDSGDSLAYLLKVTDGLGEKRGPFLVQLPPNFKADVDRLASFVDLIPDGVRVGFEFRNDSWFDDAVYDVLRAKNAAVVFAEADDRPESPAIATADWGYARLRKTQYDKKALVAWSKRISECGWNEAFVFFKHEDGGAGPKFATEFAELTG